MTVPADIDKGWAWLVAVSCFFLHVLTFGFSWSIGVYNVIFLEVFDDSKTAIAWAGSLNTALLYATGPISSVLTNRFGCRLTVVAGGALSSLGVMLSYFAPNIYFLYFTFGVMAGIGLGVSYVPSITAVAQYFQKYRGIATGLVVSGVGVGTFIFPPTIIILHHTFGWRNSLLLLGAVLLNIIVCGAVIRPVHRVEHRQEEQPVFDVTVFRKQAYILIFVNNILVCFSLSIVYLHLVAFAENRSISEQESSLLMSAIGVTNIIGRFILGSIGGHSRVNVILLYSLCWILSGVVACFFPVASNSYIALVALSCVFGFCTACFGALLPHLLVLILGLHKFANGYGFLLVAMAVGQMIGGPFAGYLFDVTESYDTSFYVSGSVLILGGVVPLFKACSKSGDSVLDADIPEEELGEKLPLPSSKEQCNDA